TLEAFMSEHIFSPLGLEDSSFYLPREKSDRLPAIYRREEGELVLDRPAGEDFSRSTFFHGGGGVRSAPNDILKFAGLFLNGGEANGVRLLRPETVDRMMTDQLGGLAPEHWQARGLSWGFGAAVTYTETEDRSGPADRYGWVGGGFAKLWVDRNLRLVAYLNVPLTPPGDNDLLRAFEREVYSALAPGFGSTMR
ncbi:MAG: serine hydrolase, partial [Xanthomonadales bacterium]|nr:serine hydrolase [Xanthomonadales bacterium]